MKKITLLNFIFLVILFSGSMAQNAQIDSLKKRLLSIPPDTNRAQTYYRIAQSLYGISENDAAKNYADSAIILSDKISFKAGKAQTLKLIGNIYIDQGNYPEALRNYLTSLKIFEETGDKIGIAACYNNIGNVYINQGNYPEALKNQLVSLKIREEIDDKKGIAFSYTNIGNIYAAQDNYSEALKNYFASLKLREETGDKNGIATCYVNIGNIYVSQGNYTEGMNSYLKSLKLREEIDDKYGLSAVLNNIGSIYEIQGNYPEALKNQLASLKLREEIGDKNGIATCYVNIGNIYYRQGKYVQARTVFDSSLKISHEIGANDVIRDGYHSLAGLDSATGNWQDAFEHYRLYTLYRDSLINEENTKKITQQQMQYEFDKKDAATKAEQEKKDAIALKELQKQKLVRNGFIGGFAVVLLFAGVFFSQRNKIKKGKKRSDELLLNILPSEVAEELKEKGSADAKQFDEVTVMFTDFKGFTQISEKLSPTELVNEIHSCFKVFDNIISKHNIEKIKTIGDSYMCAGGLPVANRTNATDVVNAALEIQQFMQQHIPQRKKEGKEIFEMRIGIHTGPVVAGIVGVKKFAYDIWGDTVNIASRMESSGEAGKVNISGASYELVKDKFNCIHRGKIQAKNKGEIDMYFVESA